MKILANDKVQLDEFNEVLEANKTIFAKLKMDGIIEETQKDNDKNDFIMN